ncbi:hypothetical protein [Variovorax sp. H27-G14]|uniref:hypothetical protein n=1 Tax=Variovorax sp. H27-G14 TaxID=3111914 RepID=UPI0038FC60E2
MATSAELYQLSWVIEQLIADTRRIVRTRSQLHHGPTDAVLGLGHWQLRATRIVAMKDRQATLVD